MIQKELHNHNHMAIVTSICPESRLVWGFHLLELILLLLEKAQATKKLTSLFYKSHHNSLANISNDCKHRSRFMFMYMFMYMFPLGSRGLEVRRLSGIWEMLGSNPHGGQHFVQPLSFVRDYNLVYTAAI